MGGSVYLFILLNLFLYLPVSSSSFSLCVNVPISPTAAKTTHIIGARLEKRCQPLPAGPNLLPWPLVFSPPVAYCCGWCPLTQSRVGVYMSLSGLAATSAMGAVRCSGYHRISLAHHHPQSSVRLAPLSSTRTRTLLIKVFKKINTEYAIIKIYIIYTENVIRW